jgi:hypothetical protein
MFGHPKSTASTQTRRQDQSIVVYVHLSSSDEVMRRESEASPKCVIAFVAGVAQRSTIVGSPPASRSRRQVALSSAASSRASMHAMLQEMQFEGTIKAVR